MTADASDNTTTITTTLTWRGDDLMAGVIRVGFVKQWDKWYGQLHSTDPFIGAWRPAPTEPEARAALEAAAERALRGLDDAEQPEGKSR